MKKYKIAKDIVFRNENDGIVILKTDTGEPYFVEDTAKAVWELLGKHDALNLDEIISYLKKDWELDDNAINDVKEFLDHCVKERLIDVF